MAVTVRKLHELTLYDRLSRLTFLQACELLGGREEGRQRLFAGGKIPLDNIQEQTQLSRDSFQLSLPGEDAIVTVRLNDARRDRLQLLCSRCDSLCEHMGTALSVLLENRIALGLAAPPPERQPVKPLNEEELTATALHDREKRAREEKMEVRVLDGDPSSAWCDYLVTSRLSGRSYRVALRGTERGESYCTCPDYRENTLGTCKHILHVLIKIRRRLGAAALTKKIRQKDTNVHLRYGVELALRLGAPERTSEPIEKIIGPLRNTDITNVSDLIRRIDRLERLGQPVIVYPDAEEFIQQQLHQQRIQTLVAEIRQDPAAHPLRTTLLKTELLPYQLDGVAFAAGAGRAILADDMGLGKTIQGVGTAELLAREAGISRVLVICPTSLKSQWLSEIARFSSRSASLVTGGAKDRPDQYASPAFFTICNYEQVLKDILSIEQHRWDLIILDEGQRIRNWEAQTTQTVKSLRSRFALVLSGTPMENRLEELFSVMQFVDGRQLGPAFRFFNRYRIQDEKGAVLGYQNLDELRQRLRPVLLRRTKNLVMKQLPPRNTEILHVAPTDEQAVLHAAHLRVVVSIVRKKYLTEMDLLRLRQALLMCRMTADSTALVDKKPPGYSSKLQALDELFEQLFVDGDHKAVLFSEWTSMLDLIQPLLHKRGVHFVRLEGSVPQGKRQQLVHEFQTNPECRVFLSTNAGSTGLNLQAADTVINVDLPWNPAVLEQRIARAHRMGQKRPVNVYILVTQGTLEEQMLTTISQKKELAMAALDSDSEVTEVKLGSSSMEELKSRLEVLLGAVPEARSDESQRREREAETAKLVEKREHMAAAGGQLLSAAFGFLAQMLPNTPSATPPATEVVNHIRQQLTEAAEIDEQGRRMLKITLPPDETLGQIAQTIAQLFGLAQIPPTP
ncbi:MAG: SNF2-related protein [Planctomycetota bacterium]